jgi:hypothetical protein
MDTTQLPALRDDELASSKQALVDLLLRGTASAEDRVRLQELNWIATQRLYPSREVRRARPTRRP